MNINTIYYNEDLTIKSQTTQPIRAFAEQANTIEVYAPVSAHNAGYFVVQGLKAGVPNPRLIPTERLLMYDVGDETVGGVLYHHYNAVIPGAALNDMSLMASTGIRFLAEFWYLGDTSLGVRFYDTEVPETIAGYLATDFPAAVSGDSVRVIDTDTDWDFDGADWTDFDSQHLVAVTKAPTDVADFTLQRGISTTDPTHAPTNTELILQEIRNSNVITAAMKPYMENVFAYVAAQTGAESMQFNVSTSETADAVGKVAWNNTEKTLDIMLTASSILHIGQATVVYVTNKTGSTIAKGVPVSVYGNSSDVGAALVAPVGNDVYATAMRLLGVTTESIANTASGFVCIAGEVTGLNLSAFAIGNTLYLSTAGVFTATKPTPSATVKAIVKIGEVLNHSATVGVLLVAPFAHCDINDASDVYLSGTPTNMSVLVYNSTDERWQNSTQANFLSDCAKLSAENEFTGISYYTSGLYAITVDTVHGAIKMYYAFHLYATLDKSGVYLNPSYITSVTDNFVPSKGMVDGYITTHDGSSVAHAAIRSSISDLETEIARLDGRGKSYGEIGYTTAELEAMSVGDRNTAINAAIVDGFGGAAYTPTTNDLCYDEGVGSGVR